MSQTFKVEEEDEENTLDGKSLYSTANQYSENFRSPELRKIMDLLDHWEEPESEFKRQVGRAEGLDLSHAGCVFRRHVTILS